jgi:hypothetical protein
VAATGAPLIPTRRLLRSGEGESKLLLCLHGTPRRHKSPLWAFPAPGLRGEEAGGQTRNPGHMVTFALLPFVILVGAGKCQLKRTRGTM